MRAAFLDDYLIAAQRQQGHTEKLALQRVPWQGCMKKLALQHAPPHPGKQHKAKSEQMTSHNRGLDPERQQEREQLHRRQLRPADAVARPDAG